MKKVVVKLMCENECKGNLFQIAYPAAFHLLKQAVIQVGISFYSQDLYPIEDADCVWVYDLPMSRTGLESACRKARKLRAICLANHGISGLESTFL